MALFEIKNLSKSYKDKHALNDVSFQVNNSEIVALIGRNGAGKTTLLNCIAGIISPDRGNVFYKGQSLLKDDSLLSEFGILIQAAFFDYLNAFENLSLLMRASGVQDSKIIKNRVNETLDLVGLSEKKYKHVKSFSFGMKQRMGLAQTLLTDTKFLILDEPFVGLDPLGKGMLKKVILDKAKQQHAGILFSSHDLDDVLEICDRVVMIDNGCKIYDDIFVNTRKYVVSLKLPESIDLHSLKKDFPNCDIILQENQIEFSRKENLHPILEYCVNKHLIVSDIEVKERSLYNFFAEEVQ